jgi:hypothetical protein
LNAHLNLWWSLSISADHNKENVKMNNIPTANCVL